jgi:molecular chaperone GrpE
MPNNEQAIAENHQDEVDAIVAPEPAVASDESVASIEITTDFTGQTDAETARPNEIAASGDTAEFEMTRPAAGENPGAENGKSRKDKNELTRRGALKELERLRASYSKLSTEYAEIKDRYLRLAAEMENFRKRVERDFSNRVENSVAALFTELLPIVDDLERFFNAGEENKDYEALAGGVRLIYQNMLKVLQSRGVSAMDTIGCEFDPTRHEAIFQMPVDGSGGAANIVLHENIKGYLLFDKVLRPAKVVVSG